MFKQKQIKQTKAPNRINNCVPFKESDNTDQLANEKNAKAVSKVNANSVFKG